MRKDKSNSKKEQQNGENLNEGGNNNNQQFEDLVHDVKRNKMSYFVVGFLTLLVIVSIYFQYQYELQSRYHSEDGNSEDVDYYEILGLDSSSDAATIKKKHRELARLWHPDRNPGCETCAERFRLITKAFEEITKEKDPQSASQKGTLFRNHYTQITTNNYHRLVENSNDFWVILVYESSSTGYFKYISEVFDEVSSKYKGLVRFGVIDILKQEQLLHFLPFKFQYFPNIITYLHGENSELLENMETFSVVSNLINKLLVNLLIILILTMSSD